ncbi:MAG: response regulator transcription factor [Devosia sp.]|uniref:response regulator transcription factor n=1 Tax=Devosia sp. TaxID=1871048 RepID=UPI001AD07D6B|nr:LuxR C-terminal-related transcriptional regulator [Devosia sp.]MBN9310508.1 response regulator transcription factor [Devosia sp.]MBN9316793.1 response regulator transcription factor [Devosia sp.]
MTERFYYPSFLHRDRLVHILDSDAETCEALSVLFRLEGFQAAFAIDAASFLVAAERRPPDVALVNIHIGHEDGLAILRRLKTLRTGTPVFILEDQPEVDSAVLAIKAGAADVFPKPIDSERLVRAVRDALRQDIQVGAVDRDGRRNVEVRGFDQLTPREREVLQLITNGQSNKEAGRELGISPRTIEVHRARVMEKLGARNTADLMRIVLTS